MDWIKRIEKVTRTRRCIWLFEMLHIWWATGHIVRGLSRFSTEAEWKRGRPVAGTYIVTDTHLKAFKIIAGNNWIWTCALFVVVGCMCYEILMKCGADANIKLRRYLIIFVLFMLFLFTFAKQHNYNTHFYVLMLK